MRSKIGKILILLLAAFVIAGLLAHSAPAQASSQAYTFKSVRTGAGGGFIVDVIFHPKQKDLIYAKTDMGGAYRWNPTTSTWTQLFNFVPTANWSWTGMESLAIDPSDPTKLYAAGGTYVNSWDPENGVIWRSSDQGNTWASTQMPFKMGGNMNGRGMGERLAVDPNKGSILYFGARNKNGLWKSTDSGVTWSQVTNFPDVGTFVANSTDSNNYLNWPVGITWVTFDPKTGTAGSATQTIYVGVATNDSGKPNIYRSTDGGSTWAAIPGEPTCTGTWGGTVTCADGATWTAGALNSYTGGGVGYLAHEGKVDTNGTLYVTYSDWEGPYNGGHGAVYKFVPSTSTWTNISPSCTAIQGCPQYFGYGGLGVDTLHPGTLVVAAVNSWWPDGQMFRTTDGGATWKNIWAYNGYPSVTRQFKMDISSAPWLNMGVTSASDPTPPFKFGWMMEGLNIDPFNSDRMMYGTGATLYGTTNLTAWDTGGIVTISSMAVGMEETSVLDLVSPPSGTPHLMSVVGDIGGWIHNNLDAAPSVGFSMPCSCTLNSIDYAENNPSDIVVVGTGNPSNTPPYNGSGWSTNGGGSWFQGSSDPVPGSGAGTVAMAADGSAAVWAGTTAPVSVSTTFGSSWTASTGGIPAGSSVASDRVNAKTFYALGGSKFWVSTNGGASFTASAATGLPSTGNVKAVFGHAGDVWIAGGAQSAGGGSTCSPCGIWHSTDSGTTFTHLASVASAQAIGFGLGPSAGTYSVFMAGTPSATGSINTIYRSDDGGNTWIQITDSQHMYATIQTITGDPRIYGRVYFGTNGLGIVYGDPSGSLPPTATAGPTSTTGPSNTPTKTNTPGTPTATFVPPTASATKTNTTIPTTGPTATTGSGTLTVGIDKGGGIDNTQETTFNYQIKNTGSSAVSNLSVRVYFNTDGSNAASGYVLEKYYDQSGVATISGPTLACGATNYFTISYGTTSLGAGASWEFQTALHLSSWASTYDGSNDYYHSGYAVGALPAAYTNTNFIPAFVNGTLTWGSTPSCGGATATTAPTNPPPTATKPPATATLGPTITNSPIPPTKTNTPIPTSGPTATKPPATNTPVATTPPTATKPPATATTAPTSSGSDPCSSPTVITGGGSFTVATTTCFKYVNTSFNNGGMFSVMKDGTSASDTLKWYGGLDQNATACANQSATVSGNGGQLNNFVIEKDANGQMFLTVTASASNSVTISIQNWLNGAGCSVKPTVHP